MPPEAEPLQFIADKGDSRLRLDRILVRHVTDVTRFSRTIAQQWIAAGAVQVDGIDVLRPASRVREGACVSVAVPASAPRRTTPQPEPSPLDVIFQDDSLLVVNKPAGVVVHPSYKQTSGTMLNAVLWRLRTTSTTSPGIVTRLDKDTSGLVLIALTPAVHAALQRDAAAGRLKKRYLAVVSGVPRPRSGRIRQPIGRDPLDRRRMQVSPDGAPSETLYEVVTHGVILQGAAVSASAKAPTDGSGAAFDTQHCALVLCTLVTGRTHQIRVHLASQRWPILGDRVYGISHPAIARQALHAWTLSLRHPVTGEQLGFEAPLPPDMQALLEAHGTMPAAALQSLQETSE
jgi:23S rRNA pseudouridine1911/1915/1917 synthase